MSAVVILSHVGGDAAARARAAVPEVDLVEVTGEGELAEDLRGEVLWTTAWGAPNLGHVLSRGVRWVHTFGTGMDRFPLELIGDQILTCSKGGSAIPISEWVLAAMLAFEKQMPESFVHSASAPWHYAELGGLHGRTLGLIGLGGIGAAVADRAIPFGMEVVAQRRRDVPAHRPEIAITRSLDEVLGRADHLVLTAPATAETHHLLNRETLARVKPGVHVVNIARGALIDQEALRDALDDGRVARASLDAVDPEPLPEGHWMYAHPRVRLSPHISWSMPGAQEILVDTFIENLRRYLAGAPLEGVVDVDAGY